MPKQSEKLSRKAGHISPESGAATAQQLQTTRNQGCAPLDAGKAAYAHPRFPEILVRGSSLVACCLLP